MEHKQCVQERERVHVGGAARVVNGAGDEDPPLAVDHQSSMVVRHIVAKRRRNKEAGDPTPTESEALFL